jgi:hypothetical protein
MNGNIYEFYIDESDEGRPDAIELCHDDEFTAEELRVFGIEALFAAHRTEIPTNGWLYLHVRENFVKHLVEKYGFREFGAVGADLSEIRRGIVAGRGDEMLYASVRDEFKNDHSLKMVGIYEGRVAVRCYGRNRQVVERGFEDPDDANRVGPLFCNNGKMAYANRFEFNCGG